MQKVPVKDHGEGSAGREQPPVNTSESDNVAGREDKVGRNSVYGVALGNSQQG